MIYNPESMSGGVNATVQPKTKMSGELFENWVVLACSKIANVLVISSRDTVVNQLTLWIAATSLKP